MEFAKHTNAKIGLFFKNHFFTNCKYPLNEIIPLF